jgi:hypothetical protein
MLGIFLILNQRPKVYRFISELIFRLVLGRDEKYLDRTDSGQSVIQEIIQRDRQITIDEAQEIDKESTPVKPIKKSKKVNIIQESVVQNIDCNPSQTDTQIEILIESHHSVYFTLLILGFKENSQLCPSERGN